MRRTEKDEHGNWCLRGVPWEHLRKGHTLTEKDAELLYAALWKLMKYEETGLSPELIEQMDEFYREKCEELVDLKSRFNGFTMEEGALFCQYDAETQMFDTYKEPYCTVQIPTEEDYLYLQERIQTAGWIPVTDRLPDNDDYILLSFESFSLAMVGRYENGAFYIGDEDESCVQQDLYVNAWMPLPERYVCEEEADVR